MVTEIVNIKLGKITQIFYHVGLHKTNNNIKITISILKNAIKSHFITTQLKIRYKYYVYL